MSAALSGADEPVAVPADPDVEDRLVAGLTLRQLGYLSAAAAGGVLAWRHPPGPAGLVAVACGAAVGLVAAVGAWWRPGGRPLDAWVVPLRGYHRRRAPGRHPRLVAAAAWPGRVAGSFPEPAVPDSVPAGGRAAHSAPSVAGRRRRLALSTALVVLVTAGAAAGVALRPGRPPAPAVRPGAPAELPRPRTPASPSASVTSQQVAQELAALLALLTGATSSPTAPWGTAP